PAAGRRHFTKVLQHSSGADLLVRGRRPRKPPRLFCKQSKPEGDVRRGSGDRPETRPPFCLPLIFAIILWNVQRTRHPVETCGSIHSPHRQRIPSFPVRTTSIPFT